MREQITCTTIMEEVRRVVLESGERKYTRVALKQYSDSYGSFFILTKFEDFFEDFSEHGLQVREDTVIHNGKEAMIKAVNLWNSVIMEKDFAPDDDPDVPF